MANNSMQQTTINNQQPTIQSANNKNEQQEEVDNGRIVNNDDIVDAPVDGDAKNNIIAAPARAAIAVNGLNTFNPDLARASYCN